MMNIQQSLEPFLSKPRRGVQVKGKFNLRINKIVVVFYLCGLKIIKTMKKYQKLGLFWTFEKS